MGVHTVKSLSGLPNDLDIWTPLKPQKILQNLQDDDIVWLLINVIIVVVCVSILNRSCLYFLSTQATNVVIMNQPTPTAIVYEHHYGTGDRYLILSVVLSFISFFSCTWWHLLCTIPAIFFSLRVSKAKQIQSQIVPLSISCLKVFVNIFYAFKNS